MYKPEYTRTYNFQIFAVYTVIGPWVEGELKRKTKKKALSLVKPHFASLQSVRI